MLASFYWVSCYWKHSSFFVFFFYVYNFQYFYDISYECGQIFNEIFAWELQMFRLISRNWKYSSRKHFILIFYQRQVKKKFDFFVYLEMINHINKINLYLACDKLFVNNINSWHIHDYFYVRNLFLPDKSAPLRHPS